MSTALSLPSGITADLATLLAAGILRLGASPESNLRDSTATCLELPAPAPLSVTSPRVNGAETPFHEGSER